MSYLLNIDAFQGDNMGSLLELQVIRITDIDTLPELVDGVRFGDIEPKSGKAFVTWSVTKNTPRARATGKTSFEGQFENDVVSFVIPKDQPTLRNMLNMTREDTLLLLYKDANGQTKGMGSLESPARFRFNFDSGAQTSQRNAYTCEFYSEGAANTWFYNGEVATAPSGPAPALVKDGEGNILAQLAPGETFNITSGFRIGFRLS